MVPEKALLPLFYNAPVQYFTKFFLHTDIIIEKHANYNRQSYLNRCIILSANGPLSLSIPVITGNSPKPRYTDVYIDYTKRWDIIHWRAIESAYRNAPFFLYYADAFHDLYEKQTTGLWDWNLSLMKTTLQILEINSQINFSERWENNWNDLADYRNIMHPKSSHRKHDPFFKPARYFQVFQQRFGFVPNLSILDLIFNAGPDAPEILKASVVYHEKKEDNHGMSGHPHL